MRICVIRGFDSLLERDASGNVIAGSTHGAAGLLSRGSVQYQFDHLGDATIRLDGSGNVLSYRLFDAWGTELSGGTEPYGYRARYGYYADTETGLIALAHRYYAPGVGRFLNRDPQDPAGGAKSGLYVGNRPVKLLDRTGLNTGTATKPRWPPFEWPSEPAPASPAPRPVPVPPGPNFLAAFLAVLLCPSRAEAPTLYDPRPWADEPLNCSATLWRLRQRIPDPFEWDRIRREIEQAKEGAGRGGDKNVCIGLETGTIYADPGGEIIGGVDI